MQSEIVSTESLDARAETNKTEDVREHTAVTRHCLNNQGVNVLQFVCKTGSVPKMPNAWVRENDIVRKMMMMVIDEGKPTMVIDEGKPTRPNIPGARLSWDRGKGWAGAWVGELIVLISSLTPPSRMGICPAGPPSPSCCLGLCWHCCARRSLLEGLPDVGFGVDHQFSL
jgi:hypothetical protein